jgi:hypothetical protein
MSLKDVVAAVGQGVTDRMKFLSGPFVTSDDELSCQPPGWFFFGPLECVSVKTGANSGGFRRNPRMSVTKLDSFPALLRIDLQTAPPKVR